MDYLRGPFSPISHNYFTRKSSKLDFSRESSKAAKHQPSPPPLPDMSGEARVVVNFVKENWKDIVTAFLLYTFVAATFTSLKGRELVAFSSMAAAWTVFQGVSVWSLATAAPIIYGIARVIFNWATAPAQGERQQRFVPSHQPTSHHADAPIRDQAHDPRRGGTVSQDQRVFERAWQDAQSTLSRNPPRSTTDLGLQADWDRVSLEEERVAPSVSQTLPVVDLDQESGERERVETTSRVLHTTAPMSSHLGKGVPVLIPSPTSAHVEPSRLATEHDLEAAWGSVRRDPERREEEDVALPVSHHTLPDVDVEEERREKVEPTPQLVPVVAAEEEEVVDRSSQPVKTKEEVSDRAVTQEKIREARRIVWQFAQIANERQAQKISLLEPKNMVATLLLDRELFFNRMEVTPEQRIALLLPSVLTETQAKKLAVGAKQLHQAATHFQADLFEYFELTASQKMELTEPPIKMLAKL